MTDEEWERVKKLEGRLADARAQGLQGAGLHGLARLMRDYNALLEQRTDEEKREEYERLEAILYPASGTSPASPR